MDAFTFNSSAKVVFKAGGCRALAQLTQGVLGQRVMLITDPGIRQLGLERAAVEALRGCAETLSIFDRVAADPTLEILNAAIAQGLADEVDSVVAIGGGSSLDIAKLVALVLGSKESLDDIWGVDKVRGHRLPLVLIPTTAGTGSEVTPVAIITLEGDEKRGVSSAVLLPDIALLDPELTLTLPASITAATGVDAMVHAIEAYTSTHANNNPVSKMLAREALALLAASIETAVSAGDNLEARSDMLLGSMLAGAAFANSPVAAVHALAYPLGGVHHIPHGLSNALVLCQVMRFNAQCEVTAAHYLALAPIIFPGFDIGESSVRDCECFIDRLAALIAGLGLPTQLRDVGVEHDGLAKLASEAMKQQRLLQNNPRAVSESDALQIYREAW